MIWKSSQRFQHFSERHCETGFWKTSSLIYWLASTQACLHQWPTIRVNPVINLVVLWSLHSGSARLQNNSEDHGRVSCENGPQVHFRINLFTTEPAICIFESTKGAQGYTSHATQIFECLNPPTHLLVHLCSGFNCYIAEGVPVLICSKDTFWASAEGQACSPAVAAMVNKTNPCPMGLVSGGEGRQSTRKQTPDVIPENSKCQDAKEMGRGFVFGRQSWESSLTTHNIYAMVVYFIWDIFFDWGHTGNTISMLKGLGGSITHVCFCFSWEVSLEHST